MSQHPCYMCGDTGIQGAEQGVTFGGGTCYCEAGKAVQAKADSNLNNGCTCGSRSDSHRQTCKLFWKMTDDQLKQDYLLYGACYYTLDEQGFKTRIDPTKLIMRVRGIDAEMVERAKGRKL